MTAQPTPAARQLEDRFDEGRFSDVLAVFDAEYRTCPPASRTQYLAAFAAARLGAYGRALLLGEAAHRGMVAARDAAGAMRAANLLGGVAFELGKLDQAEARFEETIRRAQRLNDAPFAARATNNLASLAHLRGKNHLAHGLYRSALIVYRTINDSSGTAQTGHNLAILERSEGRLMEARAENESAVSAAERSGDGGLLALTLLGRAETAIDMGDLGTARRDLDRAVHIANAAGDEAGLAELQRIESLLALREGQYDVALREAGLGYDRAVRLGSLQLQGECAAISARASRALQCPDLAERFRHSAFNAFRSLGAEHLLRRFEMEWAS